MAFNSPAARHIATTIINSAEHKARRDLVHAWLQWQQAVDERAADAHLAGGLNSIWGAIGEVLDTKLSASGKRPYRLETSVTAAAEALRAAKDRMA